ncbi:MAG: LysR family transcriptional regulator [Clostridia bacterium]
MLDNKLETLLTVNEKRSFTQAATVLSLTQPAVSHHINLLEQELGVKIFHRGKRDIKLTADGEIVLKYAKRMKALYEIMQQEISDEKKHMTKIKVGITHTAESGMITEVLAKYSNENIGVSITIITDTINNLYDKLSNYELDLAIVEGKINNPGVNSILLDTDYLVCVVSNNNPLAKKSMVTLNDIKKEKMILRLPNSGTRNLFIAHLESINMLISEFNVVLEVDNIATIKDLIRKDMGISILAHSACLDELSKGKITALPIENLSMIRETNILYLQDFDHNDILQAVTKMYWQRAKIYS